MTRDLSAPGGTRSGPNGTSSSGATDEILQNYMIFPVPYDVLWLQISNTQALNNSGNLGESGPKRGTRGQMGLNQDPTGPCWAKSHASGRVPQTEIDFFPCMCKTLCLGLSYGTGNANVVWGYLVRCAGSGPGSWDPGTWEFEPRPNGPGPTIWGP